MRAPPTAEAKTLEDSINVLAFKVAALLAVDPNGLGGAVLRGPADPLRDEWLEALRKIMPQGAPWRRVPIGIADSRLLGGLDLTASLSSGRPIAQRGLLSESDGGVVILPMAERVEGQTIARIAAVLDQGAVNVAREGVAFAEATRFAVIALDEGASAEEQVAEALSDRLAFQVNFPQQSAKWMKSAIPQRDDVQAARQAVTHIRIPTDLPQAFCAAALALGILSLRAPVFAL
ncbi:MAG: magnesium chelatase ATPase subunit D, partial [Alphaproteobacteria bacterium]|nr:magnesium chelatase ATPase subunit D [Alphaproteobacteria bacterium]